MPFSKSPLSFEDIREALDRAVSAPRGIRVRFETPGQAILFRSRANHFRARDRRDNATIYPEGHEMHKQSVYDKLKITIKDSSVLITPYTAAMLDIEELES